MEEVSQKYRIFISHSSENDEFGIQLAEDLRYILGNSLTVWYDHSLKNGLQGGDIWQRVINKKLRECTTFILILSPDANKSPWVESEAMYAIQQSHTPRSKKHILPVLYQQGKGALYDLVMQYQHISFPPADQTKIYELALHELLQALHPPKQINIKDIKRLSKEARQAQVGEIIPEIKAALDKGNENLAFDLLLKYIQWYSTHELWNYVYCYTDAALRLRPKDPLMQSMRREAMSHIKTAQQNQRYKEPRHGLYDVFNSPIVPQAVPEHRNKAVRTNYTQRRKQPKTTAKLSNQATYSTYMNKTPQKRLPKMTNPTILQSNGGIGLAMQDCFKFLGKGFDIRQINKKCRRNMFSWIAALFFSIDVFALPTGIYTFTHSWWYIVCSPLLFLLGLWTKRNWLAALFSVLLGGIYILVLIHYSWSLPIAIAVSAVVSSLQLSLFLSRR